MTWLEPFLKGKTMQKYNYTFTVWARSGMPQEFFDLFECLKQQRVTMPFTGDEFGKFRAKIEMSGLLLTDIERVPLREPEVVP